MELDITHMMGDSDIMATLSGSIAELGNNAGQITWRNSLKYAESHRLLRDESARAAARAYFRDFGAWDAEEIASWSNHELEALVTQYIAGSIREMEGFDSFEAFEEARDGGNGIYRGDDGRWYIYIGS